MLKQTNSCLTVMAGLITFGLLLFAEDSPALAQSNHCRSLAAELARMGTGGTVNPEFTKWDQAAKQQDAALAKTRRQIARANCQANASQSGSCKQLFEKQSQMVANLKKLERQRNRYAGKSKNSSRSRNRIKRRMASLKCGENRQQEARASSPVQTDGAKPESSLFSRLFGGRSRAEYNETAATAEEAPRSRYNPNAQRRTAALDNPQTGFYGGGQYRTLCVRTCDGFYFPISFSTRASAFGVDDSVCQNMCPGADARLFVHRNPGQDTKDMTGLDGVPYTALPMAFKYRTELVKNCSCQISGSGRIKALNKSGDPIQDLRLSPADDRFLYYDLEQTLVVPVAKIPAGEDPDTIDNILGNFVPYSLERNSVVTLGERKSEEADPNAANNTKRKVRKVGPDYFVAQ
ncbi:MAG: DUF2865 domain-containing protein [Stappiaceae bacterium]